MIRILLAEDQALVRDGFVALLQMEPDVHVSAVSNGREALEAAAAQKPDIAVIDVRMPVMDGIACAEQLRRRYPRLPILILTTFDERNLVRACLDAGANAYLLKDIDPAQLVAAIRLLLLGEQLIPGDLARAVLQEQALSQTPDDNPLPEALTPRQEEVLQLVADGLTNREIARRLHLSEGTVKNAVSEIYAKLGVRDRVQAVLKALGERH